MNLHKLREAQASFENKLDGIINNRKIHHNQRLKFVKHFTYDYISRMDIDEYVTGLSKLENGLNFCYFLERKLDGLGRITGSPSHKFGIWYGHNGKGSPVDYYFVKRFGNNRDEAFKNVQKSLLELLTAGEENDLNTIKRNMISPLVKGKILATYFPEKHLNIFSSDHLDFYITQFDLDNTRLKKLDEVDKREILTTFKINDPVMKKWPLDLFGNFLYSEYPGPPPKNKEIQNDILSDYIVPVFPNDFYPEYIDLDILPHSPINQGHNVGIAGKKDYEKEARKLKLFGDRGEKIVLDLEVKRLNEANRSDLAEKVERVSLKSDSFGYDILSFEIDGKPRLIEVKATSSDSKLTNFFLTSHELKTAEESDNYYLYIVYDVKSTSPKVWATKNPFKNPNFQMETVKYRVSFRSK